VLALEVHVPLGGRPVQRGSGCKVPQLAAGKAQQATPPQPRAPNQDHATLVTTLMVRNLPRAVTKQAFLDELDSSGFRGRYNFAYLPRDFCSGGQKGYAFVNFNSESDAEDFKQMWHNACRLGARPEDNGLDICDNCRQGFAANVRGWSSSRLARVKDPNNVPFIAPVPLASGE